MHGTYSPTLVALSVLVAMLASYTALDLGNRVAVARGKTRAQWLVAGALAMGAGIWSMHFIGMLAFRIPGMRILYDVPLMVLSIAIAVLASGLALFVVSRASAPWGPLAAAAVIMGVAIAGMHYVGMWSMRMPATITWHRPRVAASVLIAIAASFVALWLAVRYRYDRSYTAAWVRAGGGVVMGLAIAGMHYTGMSAASFVMASAPIPGDGERLLLATEGLSVTVVTTTLFILVGAIGAAAVSRELARRTAVAERSATRSIGLERQASELEAVNAELRLAEQRLRAIVDSALDAMVTIDANSVITEWNRNAETMFGWTAAEAIGRTLGETIIPPAYRARHTAGLERLMRTGKSTILNRRIEITALRRSGQEFPIELAIARIGGGDSDGETSFISFIRDVTAQKEAEQRERDSLAREHLILATERERARLVALFEQAPAAISFLEGPEHVVTLHNRKYDELSGHRDVLGRPLREAFPELVDQGYIDLLDQVRATGEACVRVGAPMPLASPDDGRVTERYTNFLIQPIRDADGNVTGIFTHTVDVTDIVRAKQEAEAASRAKNDFLSRVSHEFRTPLNAILGFGQLLELEVLTDANRESVQQVVRAGRHLLGLIDEILDISRIEAGQLALAVEPVIVADVVEQSIDLVRLMGEKHGIRVLTDPSPHLRVMADPQRLKQVLLNLLSNAIKYNRPGGAATVSWENTTEGRARIVVRDTGPGIPKEGIDRLFRPFERLNAQDSGVEGFGLGLALSRGLMEAMGGTLAVESQVGEGSRFHAELAVAPTEGRGEASSPSSAAAKQGTAAEATQRTVLVVEDNPANLRLMERIFRRRPHVKLLTAMQGRLALDLAREHSPDLILLDLNLPDISGDKVLLALREDPALRSIPVVMISGDAIPAQVQRLMQLGADAYLTKPFNLEEFYAVLDERLNARGQAPS